jgi:hypothetical protein
MIFSYINPYFGRRPCATLYAVFGGVPLDRLMSYTAVIALIVLTFSLIGIARFYIYRRAKFIPEPIYFLAGLLISIASLVCGFVLCMMLINLEQRTHITAMYYSGNMGCLLHKVLLAVCPVCRTISANIGLLADAHAMFLDLLYHGRPEVKQFVFNIPKHCTVMHDYLNVMTPHSYWGRLPKPLVRNQLIGLIGACYVSLIIFSACIAWY